MLHRIADHLLRQHTRVLPSGPTAHAQHKLQPAAALSMCSPLPKPHKTHNDPVKLSQTALLGTSITKGSRCKHSRQGRSRKLECKTQRHTATNKQKEQAYTLVVIL
jgi:hypothetical protein